MTWKQAVDELAERARGLVAPGSRTLLGIVGAPGGGKSTIAKAVVERLMPIACYVPMDGFHLANAELDRLGRRNRKGAPDTFDAAGYVALLRRLRTPGTDTVFAPSYYRGLEEAVAGAIAVQPDIPLVVTEGNYLLLDEWPWSGVRPLLDEAWYVDIDEETRIEQLLRRHVTFGKSIEAARAWVHGNDQRNAEVVATTRHRADLVVPFRRADSRELFAIHQEDPPTLTGVGNAGDGGTSRKEDRQ